MEHCIGNFQEFCCSIEYRGYGIILVAVDKDIARFYEKILDTENDAEPRVSVSPQLSVDWDTSLDRRRCDGNATCFRFPSEIQSVLPTKETRFRNVLTGLVLTSKIDIHLRLEVSAFEHFFKALKTLLAASGDWDSHTDLKLAAETQLRQVLQP